MISYETQVTSGNYWLALETDREDIFRSIEYFIRDLMIEEETKEENNNNIEIKNNAGKQGYWVLKKKSMSNELAYFCSLCGTNVDRPKDMCPCCKSTNKFI